MIAALQAGGRAARFVGGCVRDTLLGLPFADIDIATPEPPDRVMTLLAAVHIRAVPTGIAHGTVTALAPGRPIEVTTLRRDVETDGRHAKVAWGVDWRDDAERRDFTVNALFLSADGREVIDLVGGLADLDAGRVRFVGDPRRRLAEDVLRLLRFYRFHARFGRGPPDGAARDACRAAAPGLARLSGERIAQEMLKILALPEPAAILAAMDEDGALRAAMPGACLGRALGRVVAAERALGRAPDGLRRLAALFATREAALVAAARLRLSNDDRDRLALLAAPPLPPLASLGGDECRRLLHRLGPVLLLDAALLAAAKTDGGDEALVGLAAFVAATERPVFGLRGRDAQALGLSGAAIGDALRAVEAWWEDGGCRAGHAELLAELRRRAGEPCGGEAC